MESMSKIGIKTPITVCGVSETGNIFLVAGRHRLEAAKRLGWTEIEAIILWDCPEDEARMWEISENLARAELTALERDEHVAEWIRLAGKVSRQSDAKPQGGRGNEDGVRAAAAVCLLLVTIDADPAIVLIEFWRVRRVRIGGALIAVRRSVFSTRVID